MVSRSKHQRELSAEQRAVPEQQLQERRDNVSQTPTTPRTNSFPLSFEQQRLWFLQQLESSRPVYNIPAAFRLKGRLDIVALEYGLNEITRRHQTLQTTVVTVDGQPVQILGSAHPMMLVMDLREWPEMEREVEAQQLLNAEARKPFDLAQDPLIRTSLLRLGEQEYMFLLVTHHIISDEWSMSVLFRELATLYEAFSHRQPSPLPKLPIQYVDYAHWQRQRLQGQVLEKQLAYWKLQLCTLPVLELPTDRPRPEAQTFAGAMESFVLPSTLAEALKRLSRREGVTLFMTLLAAFKVLLGRYTGQEDIAVGSFFANRNRIEIEELIGCFVNTLTLRTDLSSNPSFRQLLRRVQEVTVAAYAHQDLPFEKLVEELQPQRDMSRTPLFQVAFTLQSASMQALKLPGVEVTPVAIHTGIAKFDLALSFKETQRGLVGDLVYNTDLFDADRITRMADHLQTLLEGIVADPDRRLSELPLLSAAERQQVLVEWNATRSDYPSEKCIHDLFAEQVERTPEALALVFADEQLSYGELNRRANQLAHYLRGLGVGPEVLVGICVERSLEMVVGLLGILKAGGAYLPLDPTYPQERLNFMLADAGLKIVLTQERLLPRLPAIDASIVCLDKDRNATAGNSLQASKNEVTPNNLAYVLYTSGSSGIPKGVAIEHHNAVSMLNWAASIYDETLLKGVLASTSICFDLSIFEVFLPLSFGGRVILAHNALQLPNLQAASEVKLVNTVPSVINELLRTNRLPASVRTINLAGEALPPSLVRQVYEQGKVEAIFDLYGPSEATTYSTFARRDPDSPATIGRPISNTQVYLLDANLNPVPVRVVGEMYLAGDGLARGYLGRPDLTAGSFIPNPFSEEPGKRLYRTGDLARYLPDGNIEFRGRRDHQVKLRGYRIELGEIEVVLKQHPAVRQAVVVARQDEPGEKRLVAYIVAAQKQAASFTELRRFLKQKLPDYMVPAAFVLLDELPLTPNGKLDRQALAIPDSAGSKLKSAFIAPRDEVESTLTQIWEEVLNTRPIGVRDNFWDLGGHSLLGTRLLAEIRKAFKCELPISMLFQELTVEHLANTLCPQEMVSPVSPFMALQPYGSKPPFYIGGSNPRFTSLARHLGLDNPSYRLDIYALQEECLHTGREPYTQIEAIATHFIEKIRAVQPIGPYFLGGGCEGGYVAYEIALQLQKQGQEVAMLILWEVPPLPFSRKKPLYPVFYLAHHIRSLFQHGPKKLVTKLVEKTRAADSAHPLSIKTSRFHQIRNSISQALQNYVPQGYPGRIILLRAHEQPPGMYDPSVGWDKLVTGGIEIHVLPGNHSTYAETHFLDFAERVKTCLDTAQMLNPNA